MYGLYQTDRYTTQARPLGLEEEGWICSARKTEASFAEKGASGVLFIENVIFLRFV